MLLVPLCALAALGAAYDWPGWSGNDNTNSRHFLEETTITPLNVEQLTPKWVFEASGTLNSQVSTWGGRLFFAAGGSIYSLDAETGQVIWELPTSVFCGGESCRSSTTVPLIYNNKVYIGTRDAVVGCVTLDGEYVWHNRLDTHPKASVRAGFSAWDGIVFVGVSSSEDSSNQTEYECCNFRGNFNALDAETGERLWQFFNIPENGGRTDSWSGGAVWGATYPVDTERRLVFYGTGQPYRLPIEIQDCERRRAPGDPTCFPENAHYNSLVALNIDTGTLAWRFRASLYDGFNEWGCAYGPGLDMCPFKDANGYNMDFAQGPLFFQATVTKNGVREVVDVVGAGQKTGVFWAVRRDTGKLVWKSFVGPGGIVGGMMYGSATDGTRVFTANTNSFQIQHKLTGTEYIAPMYGGFWSALDVNTGKIIWDQADPSWRDEPLPIYGLAEARPYGAVTVANGVVFGGTTDQDGMMYAMNAITGRILWRFSCGYGVGRGATLRNGMVYWGCGDAGFGAENAPYLYAFHLAQNVTAN